MYNNIESCIMNNGWGTNFSRIKSGINRGSPWSPYFEILVNEIIENKGIQVNCEEIKISQDADDMTLILDSNKDLQLTYPINLFKEGTFM